jgi:Inheritance of peroxisomes protein 1
MASTIHSQLPQPVRRSATLPTKLFSHQRSNTLPSLEETENASEIFYTHPSVIVKSFEPPTSQRSVSSKESAEYDYPVDTIETLPWRSLSENTLSRGWLKIEQVPGSTAFFKTRDFNRVILRNSQCWCVDRESTFVLRIARLKYWRIELPNQTDEDKKKVQELKETLAKLLRYEATPCPFKRGFTVELPEDAKTPRKKRAWKPKEWPKIIQAENAQAVESNRQSFSERRDTASSGASEEEDTDGDGTDDSGATPRVPLPEEGYFLQDQEDRPAPIPIPRSMTMPSHFLRQLSNSDDDNPSSQQDEDPPEPSSLSSSIDSFHSLHSFHSPISPFPSSPTNEETPIPDYHRSHKRDVSELTITGPVTPITPLEPATPSPPPRPSTPPNLDPSTDSNSEDESFSEAITPGPAQDTDDSLRRRLRAKTSRHRTLSPLPPPSTIFTPSPRSPTNHLANSIIQHTCSLVLGPPLQFLALLFHIATSGNIWLDAANARRRSEARDLTCDVRGSDVGDDDEGWGEDDFGVPLGGPIARTPSGNPEDEEKGQSWEID